MHKALAYTGLDKHGFRKGQTLTRREVYLESRWQEAEPLVVNRMMIQSCGIVGVAILEQSLW